MQAEVSSANELKKAITVAIIKNTRPDKDQCTWSGMVPLIMEIAESSVAWLAYDLF